MFPFLQLVHCCAPHMPKSSNTACLFQTGAWAEWSLHGLLGSCTQQGTAFACVCQGGQSKKGISKIRQSVGGATEFITVTRAVTVLGNDVLWYSCWRTVSQVMQCLHSHCVKLSRPTMAPCHSSRWFSCSDIMGRLCQLETNLSLATCINRSMQGNFVR